MINKINKKAIAIILASLTTISCFTACGSKESSSNAGTKGAGAHRSDGVLTNDTEGAKGGAEKFNDALEFGEAEINKGDIVDDAAGAVDAGAEDKAAVENNGDAIGIIGEPDYSGADEVIIDDSDKIGMLTAGEWNDHDNWGFFKNLVDTKTIELPETCLAVTNRIKVTVKNASGDALPNEKVTLYDNSDSIIWSSVTDKDGIAYLFEFEQGTANKVVASDGTEVIVDKLAVDTQSGGEVLASNRELELIIDSERNMYNNMQIQFIVDTTGSMGDEMLYLQSDFKSIAEEVGTNGKEFSTVFYKDEHDDYVVKTNPFTSAVNEITSQLGNESAAGGGDEPEAVAEALTSAFNEVEWKDNTVKIAFMIFDAPPHNDGESISKLNKAITQASDKGIRVIPVVSSNSQRDTELFGRTLAIATNGTYVFLTDDSGIGESHLEPIIGDYDVEKLHDIIVRVIKDYDQSIVD